jgi:hypothetical protein
VQWIPNDRKPERWFLTLARSASQVEIVTLAVYLCGGDVSVIDTEDAAVKANEIAPGRFTWHKYPDQINIELVRATLSGAKRRHGYLAGKGRDGWSLTVEGLAWVKAIGLTLLNEDQSRSRAERKGGSSDEAKWQRERARVTGTEAWERWMSGEQDIPVREAEAVFRIDDYAVGRTRDLKIARLHDLFEDDPDIVSFIETVAAILAQQKKVQ